MIDEQYNTRHHDLPLVRMGDRVAIVVQETSDWFRRSVQPHLRPNKPVRIDAAEGYAYALQPRNLEREPTLARRLILRWQAGRLYLDSARGIDGRSVDLQGLLTRPTLDEIAETVLARPTQDTALTKSGLHKDVQSQLAETQRQESALRLALLAQILDGNSAAMCLAVKLLGTAFGGCDPRGNLYQQATVKLETAPYVPHLRDLIASVIANPIPSAVRTAAVAFCQHLKAAEIEPAWAADQLTRA
jgi:hypothetical protein